MYLSTPAVYILTLAFAFFMGRARWMGFEIIERTKKIRDAYLVDDVTFYRDVRKMGMHASPSQPIVLFLIVGCILAGWSGVAVALWAPTSQLGVHLAALEPSTFPSAWFRGPHLFTKMAVIDWYLAVAVANTVCVLFGTTALVLQVPGGWSKWPIVPVPAYVTARFRTALEFFLAGALFYAIGIFNLVLLYGGTRDPLFVGIVSLFVIIGLLCVLLPTYAIERLADRARDQLAIAVATTYRSDIYPVAGGASVVGMHSDGKLASASAEHLLKLQDLMRSANEGAGFQRQLDVLIPVLLSQGLPFFGFFLAGFLARPA